MIDQFRWFRVIEIFVNYSWKNVIDDACLWAIGQGYGCTADEPWADFMLTTNRKFITIQLNGKRGIDYDKFVAVIQKHGVSIVNLSLSNSFIDNCRQFSELLKHMPNLKRVNVYRARDLSINNEILLRQDLPELSKLELLEIFYSNSRVVKCFQRARLKTLKILIAVGVEHLEDFVHSQERLTSLAIRGVDDAHILFRDLALNTPVSFQLTHLALCGLQNSPNDSNDLIQFLKLHAETLKELEFGYEIPSSIYEFVFTKMANLTTLWLRVSEMPDDEYVYERLTKNLSITTVVLCGVNNSTENVLRLLPNFFEKLPNIHNLTFESGCGDIFLGIAHHLKKLQSFTTDSLWGECFDGVQFPNLKTLSIRSFHGRINWNQFTRAQPLLIELTVERLYDKLFHSDDMDSITWNVGLLILRLGRGFEASKRFFKFIHENCLDLKTLELHNTCLPEELKNNLGWKVLRLCDDIRFPENISLLSGTPL